jgi:site-specific DNA-methyltransferase (adenine-specific)
MTINLYNTDCMQALREMPDNMYDLAIVDPPYGIGGGANKKKMNVSWDKNIPTTEYFLELCRVSKNQIIWGGNYMSKKIPFYSTHTIIWDKQNGESFMSDGEIAFTSFKKNTTRFYRLFWMSNMMNKSEKPIIHPTQKPISLYQWLLLNYAKQGDRILDTHLGSGSIALACHTMGYSLDAYEIDAEYFAAASARLHEHQRQIKLFT